MPAERFRRGSRVRGIKRARFGFLIAAISELPGDPTRLEIALADLDVRFGHPFSRNREQDPQAVAGR